MQLKRQLTAAFFIFGFIEQQKQIITQPALSTFSSTPPDCVHQFFASYVLYDF
jgi:hypothetical protein